MWFINAHLKNTGKGDFANEDLDIIFNRDMMVNESQVITDINNSSSLLSKHTLIANHPWIDDVDAEEALVKKEEEENIDQYANAFGAAVPSEEDDQNNVEDDNE